MELNIVGHDLMNFVTVNGEREMHYLKNEDGVIYTLSLESDSKIEDIREDSTVTCELYEDDSEVKGTAELITDESDIEIIFDTMLDLDSYWFGELTNDLILIKIKPF